MEIFEECLDHFKRLIQFNTTNPPGNEREAINYIADILRKEGLTPLILEPTNSRANLIVRLQGDGSAKPLHISSHVDVVSAEADKWKYPPFSGVEAEGCIWGRGAVDMKNMTAYCLGTVLDVVRKKRRLKRDIIMSVVADEETGGHHGMGWIVKNHPELVRSEYYLGEVGGYTVHMSGKRIYPIQVGEKGIFWIKVKLRGTPGHGSMPSPSNVHFKLSKLLTILESKTLPRHRIKTTDLFFDSLIEAVGPFGSFQFKAIKSGLGPMLIRKVAMKSPMPEKYLAVGAMLSNTANPTGVLSGVQHNVVPSEVILKLDCRVLPGFSGEDVVREIEVLFGEKLEYEVVGQSQGHECDANTPLFKSICEEVVAADPGSYPVPTLTMGSTDAPFLVNLGVTCYGFTPVKLPADLNFPRLFHGHNERIPIDGFRWGLNVFMKTVENFCKA